MIFQKIDKIVKKGETMKFHTKYLWVHTKNIHDYINITRDVEQALYESGINDGMILVSAM